MCVFLFQAEDGIRDLVRSRGLGDVYKRQAGEAPEPGLQRIDAFHRAGEVAAPNDFFDEAQLLSLIHI